MDMNKLMQLGARLFNEQLDSNQDGKLDISEISSALTTLFSSTQSQSGNAAGGLASLISGIQQSGNSDLLSLATSWLSNGPNAPVSDNQLMQIFGQDKIAEFAQQLGVSQDRALKGLQTAVPDIIDKASPNGQLDLENMLDSVGGVSGAIKMVNKLFGNE